ncbi:lipoamide acyltransferase component of branched-chain alpha-keto acid dehydrogenase complex, mitochondrial-like isoform X2 [Halichondria panicea]|uniref:lipoamide acyltransferase component of branched-chain alpha-keto acid dehydrogenase complex, mitochondrial-like isoform X2 n=1 Tax=Halichondria panicea TaxID=6063 RepID=UPI00312B55D2
MMNRLGNRLGSLAVGASQLTLARPVTRWNPHRYPSWRPSRGIHTHLRTIHTGRSVLGEVPFLLPDVGEGIQTVQIMEWLVKEGDTVTMGDDVCNVQSDKSAVTISVPYDGVVSKLMYEVDDTAVKDKPLMIIDVDGEEGSAVTTPVEETPPISTPPTGTGKDGRILKEDVMNFTQVVSGGKLLATPAVRGMAREEGVDLRTVRGTGEGGRILKEDLLDYIAATPPLYISKTTLSPQPPIHALPEDEVVPIRGIKAVMVRTMTASGQIPQFGYCDEVDMGQLVQLRSSLKDRLLEKGVKFSYMPLILKALSLALLEYPMLNAHVDQECTTITYKADHNIGIAMDTPDGLIVPNVKRVQTKSVFEIAVELNRLQELGMLGKLPPADIVGGTFSLSNIGAVGGTYAKPMILPPEVAIGAFGKVQVLPRFDQSDDLVRAHVMQVSWSADHRVIDGATIARFSNLWKSLLENPASMILDLK